MMYHLPTSRSFLDRAHCSADPTRRPPSPRCRGSSPLPEITTPIRVMACGSKPDRSAVRRRFRHQAGVSSTAAAGFVGSFVLGVAVETDPEAELDWVKGSCAVSAARLQELSNITPPPSAQQRPPVLSPSNLLPTSIYHQGRGTLFPRKLPWLCRPCSELNVSTACYMAHPRCSPAPSAAHYPVAQSAIAYSTMGPSTVQQVPYPTFQSASSNVQGTGDDSDPYPLHTAQPSNLLLGGSCGHQTLHFSSTAQPIP